MLLPQSPVSITTNSQQRTQGRGRVGYSAIIISTRTHIRFLGMVKEIKNIFELAHLLYLKKTKTKISATEKRHC